MIALKDYQTRVLDSLRDFFRQCSKDGNPKAAFDAVQLKNGAQLSPYIPVQAAGMKPDMPYVCLRVPTAGGKTLLACHAAGIAQTELLHSDRSVVLWLVPSNTILDQTADALRDPRHPYRRALELSCGPVEVVTIEEALRLSRATVDGQTVVIVSTIQCFRVQDPTGRKVYEQAGGFAEHMLNVPADRLPEMLPGADGKPTPSLVNMLRLRRPIVIVDEAHNARTDLSFDALGDVLPSCIIEFTATPARELHPSNVLHRVSAAELKAEDMVKLPLRVITRHPTQHEQLLGEAITLRADLERIAATETQATGEYLRPILLIQAACVADCEPLRDKMVSELAIPKDQVAISVGGHDELADIGDINSPKCPIRFILTVKKLAEGWDCPFAYVLCSLKATRSEKDIEQIVGRILRLPSAKAKQHPDLNCAYAFSVTATIQEVLDELCKALQKNGFTKEEAERIIIPLPQGVLPLGVHPETIKLSPADIDQAAAEVQVAALEGKVRFEAAKGEITILTPLDAKEQEKLTACVKSPQAKAKVAEGIAIVIAREKAFGGTGEPRKPSPYEQELDFIVPRLCVRETDGFFEFESTCLLEHPWKLSEKDASLQAGYNPLVRPAGRAGRVDLVDGKVQATVLPDGPDSDFVATLHQQAFALNVPTDWTVERLIAWLDRKINHQDIPLGESAEFLRGAIRGLMARYDIEDVSMLALDRHRLRDEIEARIEQHRQSERKTAFQAFLSSELALAVTDECSINFKTMTYEPSWFCDGAFLFQKHYFGPRAGELEEKTPSGKPTEEFRCAQFLDDLPEVKFWLRNLPRKASSFRLLTSKDWFYPDFLCQLNDGRILVVEYKGEHLWTAADAEEKRAVGAVWDSRSKGRCLFVMPKAGDFEAISRIARGRQ